MVINEDTQPTIPVSTPKEKRKKKRGRNGGCFGCGCSGGCIMPCAAIALFLLCLCCVLPAIISLMPTGVIEAAIPMLTLGQGSACDIEQGIINCPVPGKYADYSFSVGLDNQNRWVVEQNSPTERPQWCFVIYDIMRGTQLQANVWCRAGDQINRTEKYIATKP